MPGPRPQHNKPNHGHGHNTTNSATATETLAFAQQQSRKTTTQQTSHNPETLTFTQQQSTKTTVVVFQKSYFFFQKPDSGFRGPDDLFKRIHKNPKPGFHFNFHLFPGRCFFQFSSKIGRRKPKPGFASDEPNTTFFLQNQVMALKTLFRASSSRNQTGPT